MKALAAANHILQKARNSGQALSALQVIKLTYIANGYMLGLEGRPLLSETAQAWPYGPIVESVYHAVKRYRSLPVFAVHGDNEVPDAAQKAVMALVVAQYAAVDGIALASATNRVGTPWDTTRRLMQTSGTASSSMSNDIVQHFYINKVLSKRDHSAL